MNKEELAVDLVCLLDERSKPRNSAKFHEQVERFFIAGPARIDLIAKVMDLNNEIYGLFRKNEQNSNGEWCQPRREQEISKRFQSLQKHFKKLMISKIRDSDASQNFTAQSPQANGHLTVLKTTWYVVHFFCLRYSELLNKTCFLFYF